jgi:hypothetical protein
MAFKIEDQGASEILIRTFLTSCTQGILAQIFIKKNTIEYMGLSMGQ